MKEIAAHMKDYCYHSYGCRVVLKLYDIIAITDDSLIEGFANGFVEKNVESMMIDLNANYIIQKVIHLQPSSKLAFISDLFRDKVACLHPDPEVLREPLRMSRTPAADSQSLPHNGRPGSRSATRYSARSKTNSTKSLSASSATT